MMSNSVLSPITAFATVSFLLGQLGDGLNVFQGIYLVNIGWNEGAVGVALSLMGFTALVVQTFVGDIIDKATVDRRKILSLAASVTACAALTILFVREGNQDHALMFVSKVLEGIAVSFINPCLAALTLASFGPGEFDSVMANNVLWSHNGSFISAILAGAAAYIFYPNIKYCFFVIAFSAAAAVSFIPFLPQGDPLMGRGFHVEEKNKEDVIVNEEASKRDVEAASYLSVLLERKTLVLCLSGFFFHFANANVLLVLGELMSMGDDEGDDGDNEEGTSRSAIPLIAGAILLAQGTMSIATLMGDHLTEIGVGRKILFTAGLVTLPIRCALIIYWKDAGNAFLLSTQILDGLGGGFFSLMHPYLVADITFGTGRFNLIMGMTASCFGLGGTMSNFLGQMVVEKMGHVVSLSASFVISFIPIAVFTILMPETKNTRSKQVPNNNNKESDTMIMNDYVLT